MTTANADAPGPYRLEAGRIADRARLQQALEFVVGPRVIVLSHVPLADLLRVPAHTPEAYRHRERLEGRRVDCVLAARDTARILVAIVLDQIPPERSAFTAAVLQAVGLPMVVVPGDDLDAPDRLAERVAPFLPGVADQTIEVPVVPATVATPACPTCGAPMVLRRKLHGADHGQRFWGCSTYAQTGCRGLRPAWVAL